MIYKIESIVFHIKAKIYVQKKRYMCRKNDKNTKNTFLGGLRCAAASGGKSSRKNKVHELFIKFMNFNPPAEPPRPRGRGKNSQFMFTKRDHYVHEPQDQLILRS